MMTKHAMLANRSLYGAREQRAYAWGVSPNAHFPMSKPSAPKMATKPQLVASLVDDTTLVETVFLPEKQKTRFATARKNTKTGYADNYTSTSGREYSPIPANNALIQTGTVQLPSAVGNELSSQELVTKIQSFIHRYVDLCPAFETIATYYVLLTWVHDAFNELPYLRVRGLFGSGKTRFLQVMGNLCYRSIFASGASTVAPLFHILNSIGGTLLLDEADFRFSDGSAELVKVLNNGNAKGMPVLRCISKNGRTFEATAYKVFGPKIVASRTNFDDPGLESRFLSEDLGRRVLRKDIPVSLPSVFQEEAQELRNSLLAYRFTQFHAVENNSNRLQTSIARVDQIVRPLLAVCEDEHDQKKIIAFAIRHARQLVTDLGVSRVAHVLEAIAQCEKTSRNLSIGNIAEVFRALFADAYDRRVTAHWIGYLIRKEVHLRTERVGGTYYLADGQEDELLGLYERYGLNAATEEDTQEPVQSP